MIVYACFNFGHHHKPFLHVTKPSIIAVQIILLLLMLL